MLLCNLNLAFITLSALDFDVGVSTAKHFENSGATNIMNTLQESRQTALKFCSGQSSSSSVPSKESPHLISQALEVENPIPTTTLFKASPHTTFIGNELVTDIPLVKFASQHAILDGIETGSQHVAIISMHETYNTDKIGISVKKRTNGGKNATIKVETSSLHDASNQYIVPPPPPNEDEAEFGQKLLHGIDNLTLDFSAHGLYVLYFICTVFVHCCA